LERKLAAILVADLAGSGYCRSMSADDVETLARLRQCIDEVIAPHVAEHGGALVKLMCDGFIA